MIKISGRTRGLSLERDKHTRNIEVVMIIEKAEFSGEQPKIFDLPTGDFDCDVEITFNERH